MSCYAEVQKDSICVSFQVFASIKVDVLIILSVLLKSFIKHFN